MQSVFHIVTEPEWRAAAAAGRYEPASLAVEGFVHFSYAHQVARTANARFADHEGLVVVEFDADAIGSPVVDEDLYGAGEQFPHIYAAVPTTAAVAVHELSRDSDGEFSFRD